MVGCPQHGCEAVLEELEAGRVGRTINSHLAVSCRATAMGLPTCATEKQNH